MATANIEELSNIDTRNLEGIASDTADILRRLEADDLDTYDLYKWADELDRLARRLEEVAQDVRYAAQQAEEREDNTCIECGEVGDIDGSGLCSDCHTAQENGRCDGCGNSLTEDDVERGDGYCECCASENE